MSGRLLLGPVAVQVWGFSSLCGAEWVRRLSGGAPVWGYLLSGKSGVSRLSPSGELGGTRESKGLAGKLPKVDCSVHFYLFIYLLEKKLEIKVVDKVAEIRLGRIVEIRRPVTGMYEIHF